MQCQAFSSQQTQSSYCNKYLLRFGALLVMLNLNNMPATTVTVNWLIYEYILTQIHILCIVAICGQAASPQTWGRRSSNPES